MASKNVWTYRADLWDGQRSGQPRRLRRGSHRRPHRQDRQGLDRTSVQYIVVDTGFWIFGKKRLIPVGVVNRVDNGHRNAYVAMTKEQIKSAPDYDDARPEPTTPTTKVLELLRPLLVVATPTPAAAGSVACRRRRGRPRAPGPPAPDLPRHARGRDPVGHRSARGQGGQRPGAHRHRRGGPSARRPVCQVATNPHHGRRAPGAGRRLAVLAGCGTPVPSQPWPPCPRPPRIHEWDGVPWHNQLTDNLATTTTRAGARGDVVEAYAGGARAPLHRPVLERVDRFASAEEERTSTAETANRTGRSPPL